MTKCEPEFTVCGADAWGVPLERHRQPRAQLLASRVDALYLAFQGKLRDAVREELMEKLARVQELKTAVAVEMLSRDGDVRGRLTQVSREGWWILESAWLTITICEKAAHQWTVAVRATGALLMQAGPRGALIMAREAAAVLLDGVTGERVRRLDLSADLAGFSVGSGDLNPLAFSIHHRTKYKDIARLEQYYRRGIRTGFVFGKGDALVRIYDKSEHLALGLDEAKAEDEFSEWRQGGWNGVDRVTRTEFQLRGRLLDELGLREPDVALERLDAVWAYCTHKWMRLVLLGTASRKDRCATDPRWRELDRVVFRERAEPAKRLRVHPTPHARRMISAMINYCAAVGSLTISKRDPRQRVADWTPEQCRAWTERELTRMARATLHAATSDLFLQFDPPRDAVAHLMEKMGAAHARLAPISSARIVAPEVSLVA